MRFQKRVACCVIVLVILGLSSLWPAGAVLPQTPRFVNAIAWKPDGTEFATGHELGTVTIWDAATQQPRLTFEVAPEWHDSPVVYSLAWSPDGNMLAAAASAGGGVIKVFDPATGASLAEFRAETFTGTVAWSPDGSKLAGGATKGLGFISEGWVKVWDVATGQVVAELLNGYGDTSSAWQVSWSADGSRLACSSNDQAVIWDTTTWETVLLLEHPSVVLPVTWSPQGSRLATGDGAGTIRIWNGVSGELLSTIQTGYNFAAANKLAWSPSGTELASVSVELQIWDVATGQLLEEIPGYIHDAAWSPDGSQLVYGGGNGVLAVIDAPITLTRP